MRFGDWLRRNIYRMLAESKVALATSSMIDVSFKLRCPYPLAYSVFLFADVTQRS